MAKDFTGPMLKAFANAIVDIKADIAKETAAAAIDTAAANAERKAADLLLGNAIQTETNARNLEQPIEQAAIAANAKDIVDLKAALAAETARATAAEQRLSQFVCQKPSC